MRAKALAASGLKIRGHVMRTESGGDFMTFSYTRNRIADDVNYTVQQSPNLRDWSPGTTETMELIERIENEDGTDTIRFRLKEEVTEAKELFLRLAVEKN